MCLDTWSKNTDCCRAWDRLISLIPPKKKVDRDFSITIQALDAICEWFLDAGVLPSTCLQYVISWLRAAFDISGDAVPSSSHGSGPSHFEVALSVAIGLYKRIIMHRNYPISHDDPYMLPLASVLKNTAFNCDSVLIQVEAFDTLTQLLHVIPHSVSFLVPIALASKMLTKNFLQNLAPNLQSVLCRFVVSVVHVPGYFGAKESSKQEEMWNYLLNALHEMIYLFPDPELFSQLMWSCWLCVLDASTSPNVSVSDRLLSEISEALVYFSASNAHLVITLEVVRAAAALIPSFIDQVHPRNNQKIHLILVKLSQGLSSKINQSSISKIAEQNKNEYFHTVNNYISTIREWLIYCASSLPQDILDQVYEALILCLFDGTNIYKQLLTALEVQPTDWNEIDRIISSRNSIASRSGISISAEICLCSVSSFMTGLSALSLAQVTSDYATSLCKIHPHISLSVGSTRILTFVEDQSTWGQIWVVVRDCTGIRLWSAHLNPGDDDSTSVPVGIPPQGGATVVHSTLRSISGDDDALRPNSLVHSVSLAAKSVVEPKDQVDAEVTVGDVRPDSVSVNDDENVGGVPLLNDEDFTRPSGKLAQFQQNPHTSRVEMLGHLLDYVNESIPSSSVALDGSRAISCALIQSRNQDHERLSLKLKAMLQEENARAAQRKADVSPLFQPVSPPPVSDKRLWKLQFTRQLLSHFKFASNFAASLNARMLSAADEFNFFEEFDKLPSRDNLTVMLSLPPAGSSRDSDELLISLKVHSTRISDSEFFLSTPDRDIRFVVSSGLPPLPEGRWTSPAHVQFVWHPRDAGRFDPSSSTLPASCHCIVLQPVGANLIRVEDVLMPNGESVPIPSVESKLPLLRGCIVNVNIIEPVVLVCAVTLSNHGDITSSAVHHGPASSLLKSRFDVLYSFSQKCDAGQSFFDVADRLHSQ
jgi:hypothetical protein